jgi:hypothetical protein
MCIAVAGCADTFTQLSGDPVSSAAKVDELAVAFAARFTNVDRSGRFETARRQLMAHALTPSKLFGDTIVWQSVSSPTSRVLLAHGALEGDGERRAYRFVAVPTYSRPLKLGDTRHTMLLTRLRDSEYRWDTSVDFGIGAITAADVATAMTALLAAPDGRRGPDLRAASARAFPRAAAALGRAFVIDSFAVAPGALQTTTVLLRARLMTARLRQTHPRFAAYLARYASTGKLHLRLTDAAGTTFFDVDARNDLITVRYRLLDRKLVSYYGPPRAMPDTLRLGGDITMRAKLFDVGFRGLVTDFVIESAPGRRAWTMIGRNEPQWTLPLITERLLRAPLRRPFEGNGVMFQLAVSDSTGAMTVLSRRARLEVRESAIMRWIGGMLAKLLGDLDADVEREEAAFLREVFVAFQNDAASLLSPTKREPPAQGGEAAENQKRH